MKNIKITKNFGSIMVIVPHQDDEIILCGGVIYQAVSLGLEVVVVIVTNGDCGAKDYSIGKKRIQESVKSLSVLGLKERNVVFMGYGDTGMSVKDSFLSSLFGANDVNKIYLSHCSSETYALDNHKDFHSKTYGEAANYTRSNFAKDLETIICRYRPKNIFTTFKYDKHGDHSALNRFIFEILPSFTSKIYSEPRVFSGIVHSCDGDDKWPLRNGVVTMECPTNFEKNPEYSWNQRICFPVPKEMQSKNIERNLKFLALSEHVTALKPDAIEYLHSFIKKEEVFFLDKGELQ